MRQKGGNIIRLSWVITVMTIIPTLISEAAETADQGVPVLEIVVEGYVVTGFNPLSKKKTESIVNKYTGTFSNLDSIRDAAEALETAIKAKGYTLQSVIVPPQPISNRVITLQVVGFVISDIKVVGNKHFSEENIRRSIPGLQTGEPPNTKKLDRSLQVANKNPRKRTNLRFMSASEEEEGLETTLNVSDRSPYQIFAWSNNTGTENTGEFRLGVGLQHANLFGRDHVATATYATSPDQQEKVGQFGMNYRIPTYRAGGLIDLLYANSDIDTGRVAGGFDLSGAGEVFGGSYTQYFQKRENHSHTLVFAVADKLFENDIDFEGTRFSTNVRSRPLSVRYLGQRVGRKWVFDFFGAGFVNLPGGSFNNDVAYNLARLGASNDWTAVRFGVSAARSIGRWQFSTRIAGQYTTEPLIPGEQFGLGGLYSIRGFREREIAGDRGYWLSIQMAAPRKWGMTPLAFIDVAEATRIDPQPGELRRETLSSTGVGLRWTSAGSHANLLFYLGYVLDGADPEGFARTRDGDVRAHFNFILRN